MLEAFTQWRAHDAASYDRDMAARVGVIATNARALTHLQPSKTRLKRNEFDSSAHSHHQVP